MEEISQDLLVAFMAIVPVIATAGLLWMMYDKVLSKRRARDKSDSMRR